jgi:uncharacterized membrane protein YhiD involved in acid resistance
MLEWLTNSISVSSSFSSEQLFVRLAVAALYGGIVALVYRASHGRTKDDVAILSTTLVLLSILIAMVSLVVGDSVARAFSLVGALSIVRFRTVVEDTRDTAFVIFAVIVGMSAGAGLLVVPLVGIPIVAASAILLGRLRRTPSTSPSSLVCSLTVRLGLGRDPEAALGGVLGRHLENYQLNSVETARQGAALDLLYAVRLRSPTLMATLVAELNQIEGVQSVDLHA